MRVLIVGGSGFLSGTVSCVAIEAGHDVSVVTRGRRALPAGVTAIVADRNVPNAFAEAVASPQPWDVVVDCIGFSAEHARQDLACFVGRARTLVFISTDSVLAVADRPWRLDERFARYETTVAYGVGKRAAEVALLDGAADAAARGTLATILRPCHIYGAGSLLGCLPEHGRDPNLIEHLRAGRPLRLVGGGHFLQQPVAAADVAAMALSCAGTPRVAGEIYCTAGPDIVATRDYYRLICDALGVPMPDVVEVPIDGFLAANPERRAFCCHRVYSMQKAASHGLAVPATSLADGLAAHVRSMAKP